jgi:hypothetical protein
MFHVVLQKKMDIGFPLHVYGLLSIRNFHVLRLSISSQVQRIKTISGLPTPCIQHLKGSKISFDTFKDVLEYLKNLILHRFFCPAPMKIKLELFIVLTRLAGAYRS